jgi:hypothetical protein
VNTKDRDKEMILKKALLALLLGLALAGGANAATCTIDQVPGATLLLPYFEVDIANPAGVDTLFTINNASATAVLTHVVVWTDMSVEALDFNIYLTGYDMQTVSMGLIIRDGVVPVTATAGQDPRDTISPQGPLSQDINFASCNGFFPYSEPALDEEFLDHLQSILTGGVSSIYGNCGGWDYGDGIARGYVTIDTMSACTLLRPCDPGYFQGLASYQNVLWGNWFIVEGDENFAMGDTMVALEAFPGQTAANPFVNGTFWGRCNGGGVYSDFREPLPSSYGVNYYNNAAFTGGTDFVVWRDSETPSTDGFSCTAGPSWFPLPQNQVVIFDEQENPEEGGCTISPCPEEGVLFPIEAQRVPYAALGGTPESGWVYMNLGQYGSHAQAWAVPLFKAEGRYAAGIAATQVSSSCQPAIILPID